MTRNKKEMEKLSPGTPNANIDQMVSLLPLLLLSFSSERKR